MATRRAFRKFLFRAVVALSFASCMIAGRMSTGPAAKPESIGAAVRLRSSIGSVMAAPRQLGELLMCNTSTLQFKALAIVSLPVEFEVAVEEDASVEVYRAASQFRAFSADRDGPVPARTSVTPISLGTVSAPLLV